MFWDSKKKKNVAKGSEMHIYFEDEDALCAHMSNACSLKSESLPSTIKVPIYQYKVDKCSNSKI